MLAARGEMGEDGCWDCGDRAVGRRVGERGWGARRKGRLVGGVKACIFGEWEVIEDLRWRVVGGTEFRAVLRREDSELLYMRQCGEEEERWMAKRACPVRKSESSKGWTEMQARRGRRGDVLSIAEVYSQVMKMTHSETDWELGRVSPMGACMAAVQLWGAFLLVARDGCVSDIMRLLCNGARTCTIVARAFLCLQQIFAAARTCKYCMPSYVVCPVEARSTCT